MTPVQTEKLTDQLDIASELETTFRANALREVQARMTRSQEPRDGVYEIVDCIECGEDIGIGRLNAAAKNTICIECATVAERMKR